VAVDVHCDRVAAVEALLVWHAGPQGWFVRRADLFELDARRDNQCDVVYG
jgi:predicted signal transduction protein with EAL and GGDEF domain